MPQRASSRTWPREDGCCSWTTCRPRRASDGDAQPHALAAVRELARADVYGVYFKVADKSVVWYQPGAVPRAGIKDPPATWDELLAEAAALRGPDHAVRDVRRVGAVGR